MCPVISVTHGERNRFAQGESTFCVSTVKPDNLSGGDSRADFPVDINKRALEATWALFLFAAPCGRVGGATISSVCGVPRWARAADAENGFLLLSFKMIDDA